MAVDDSSSSPSFRELDDVFLQSQARIWLGEVLQTRFDEQLSICDLLSDGELLFEVSKALWNMLLVQYMELNNLKARMFIPADTRKSSGRYRPYSNIDSFLKVCKVLGLSGVDLFSPSDVVEKKDARKVCLCIRSLSKKARSKQLNILDFDIVTKTVAMPTDVVRCIRRSLELSTASVTHGQSKHPRLKFSSFATHKQEIESFLEESDEAKSNFTKRSYADFLYLESGESPETVDKYAPTQGLEQADTRNQEIDKFPHTPGSAESIFLQYASSDSQLDGILSHVRESRLIICDEYTPINHGTNALSPPNMGEVNHPISLSDMISFRILTNVPFHISEDCLCHSCMATESHNSNTTDNASMCRMWRKYPDDVEASPTSSVSSVVGRVLDFDFDFDAKSEPDDAKLYCSVDQDLESLNQISRTQKDLGDSLVLVKDSIQETVVCKGSNDKLMKGVESAIPKSTCKVDGTCDDHVAVKMSERCDRVIQHQSGKGFGNVKKEDDQLCTTLSDNVHCYAEDRSIVAGKDERKDDDDGIDCLAEANTNGKNDKRTVNTEKKPTYIAPLLKVVAKSTALIGILFLLHLRNRSDRNTNDKSTEKSSQIHWKSSGVGFSRRKGENGSKIYPVEKFKFGD